MLQSLHFLHPFYIWNFKCSWKPSWMCNSDVFSSFLFSIILGLDGGV